MLSIRWLYNVKQPHSPKCTVYICFSQYNIFHSASRGICLAVHCCRVCPLVAAWCSACPCPCSPCCCRACGCRWRCPATSPGGGHRSNKVSRTLADTRAAAAEWPSVKKFVKESFYTQAVVGPTFPLIVLGSAAETEYL